MWQRGLLVITNGLNRGRTRAFRNVSLLGRLQTSGQIFMRPDYPAATRRGFAESGLTRGISSWKSGYFEARVKIKTEDFSELVCGY